MTPNQNFVSLTATTHIFSGSTRDIVIKLTALRPDRNQITFTRVGTNRSSDGDFFDIFDVEALIAKGCDTVLLHGFRPSTDETKTFRFLQACTAAGIKVLADTWDWIAYPMVEMVCTGEPGYIIDLGSHIRDPRERFTRVEGHAGVVEALKVGVARCVLAKPLAHDAAILEAFDNEDHPLWQYAEAICAYDVRGGRFDYDLRAEQEEARLAFITYATAPLWKWLFKPFFSELLKAITVVEAARAAHQQRIADLEAELVADAYCTANDTYLVGASKKRYKGCNHERVANALFAEGATTVTVEYWDGRGKAYATYTAPATA